MAVQESKYIRCPYESSHRILREKLQFHLTRCEYVNRKSVLTKCPYNATHKEPFSVLVEHINTCPDRRKLDDFLFNAPPKPLAPLSFDIKCESWDDENHATYNPEVICENKAVLLLKQVVPPSERKQFRLEERRRYQNLLQSNYTPQLRNGARLLETKTNTQTKKFTKNDYSQLTGEKTEAYEKPTSIEISKTNNDLMYANGEINSPPSSGSDLEEMTRAVFITPRYSRRKFGKKKSTEIKISS